MAGESAPPPPPQAPKEQSQFKGLSKYFNSITDKGRSNTAKATYLGVGLVFLYFALRPRKQPPPPPCQAPSCKS